MLFVTGAIGSTCFSKVWVLNTIQSIKENPNDHKEDLESLSEMSTDDEVASFLCSEKSQFPLLSAFLNSNFRCQEFILVILSNMLRQDFSSFQADLISLKIPIGVLVNDLSTDPDYVQVLVVLFQYLTIYNDNLILNITDEDKLEEQLEYHFELAQKVVMIMASTLNEDLLKKSSRCLFSILDLASEVKDPLKKIGHLLSPPALGCLNEALSQALKMNDDKTAFVIVEILASLFDHIEDDQVHLLDLEHANQLLNTINVHLNEESTDLESVKSSAKICVVLWTSACHLESFESIAKVYLQSRGKDEDESDQENEHELKMEVIKQCLKHFLTVHSGTLLEDQNLLSKPVIRDIVAVLL